MIESSHKLVEQKNNFSEHEEAINIELERESEKIAQTKLEKLLDDGFKTFGIRFANIGEYKQIIKTGGFEDREAFIYEGEKAPSFKRWIEQRKQQLDDPYFWIKKAKRQTDWAIGVYNMSAYTDLIALLHEAHRKACIAVKNKEDINIKEETMKIFRSLLIEGGDEDVEVTLATRNSISWLSRCVDRQKYTDKSDILSKRIDVIGQQNLEVMKNFIHNPDFLNTPQNLRSLIKTIAYCPVAKGEGDYVGQYHLALIFDIEAVSDTIAWGHPYWRFLKSKKDIHYEPSDNFLGTIICMPDKELTQEVITQSSQSKKWAHVVFDDKGVIRYPKTN